MSPRKVAWAIIKTIVAVVISAVIMMLIYRFALEAYDFGYRIFAEDPVSPEPGMTLSVAIVEGKSAMDIGKILEEKKLKQLVVQMLNGIDPGLERTLQPAIARIAEPQGMTKNDRDRVPGIEKAADKLRSSEGRSKKASDTFPAAGEKNV